MIFGQEFKLSAKLVLKCSNGAMKLFQPVSTIVPLTHPIDFELEWKLWNKMGNGDMTRMMSCICTQKFQFFSFSISSFFKFKLFFSFIRFHIHFSFTFCCCLSQLQRTSESQVVVLDFWSQSWLVRRVVFFLLIFSSLYFPYYILLTHPFRSYSILEIMIFILLFFLY